MDAKLIKKIIPIALIAIPLVLMYKGSGMKSGERCNLLPQKDSIKSVSGNSVTDVFSLNEVGASAYCNSTSYSWAAMQSVTTMNSGTTNTLKDVWGSSASDVFAVGVGGIILHYDGNPEGTWSPMDNSTTTNTLNGVWGSSASDVFAVGVGGIILHYDGNPEGTWTAIDSITTSTLNGVWGSSASDVFAVGWDGTILHYDDDGSGWDAIGSKETQAHYFGGVWGSSASDVYVVGGFTDNEIFHYDGATWVNTFSSEGDELFLQAVWGSAASNVFAVGTGGITHHYKGSVWDTMNSGTTNTLRDVWGSSASDVFAVGVGGIILHYDGNPEGNWSSDIESGTAKILSGIWGSSANDVFVVGNGGTIIRLQNEVIPPSTTSIPQVTTTSVVSCASDAQCDDSLFCNGAEGCNAGVCQPGNDPCGEGEECDEENDECRIPPAPCEISVDPNTAEVASGQTWTFTIITTAGDCTHAAYQWSVESDIGSTIDKEGNYVAGTNNNLFSPATDVVSVLEQTGGNEASATVTVAGKCFLLKLYGEDPETIKLLRNFRDHVLSKTPEGREIIRRYYQLSPFIGKAMEKDGVFKDEMRDLVEGILPLIAIQ